MYTGQCAETRECARAREERNEGVKSGGRKSGQGMRGAREHAREGERERGRAWQGITKSQ